MEECISIKEDIEIWKEIPMLDGRYEASNFGNIRNANKKNIKNESFGKVKKKYTDKQGYERVGITLNKKTVVFRVHNLIMNAFYGDKPFDKAEINHIDGNKMNNRLDNLEWCTAKENSRHSVENGLFPKSEDLYNTKHKEVDILDIYRLYKNGHSLSEIALLYDDNCKNIRRIVKGERWGRTYIKYYEYIDGDNVVPPKNIKPVIIDNGIEVLEFNSQTECAKYLNVNKSAIGTSIKHNWKVKGYKISLK